MGTNTSVNNVSCHDITRSVEKYAMMRIGFLNSMSRDDMIEFSTSATSPLIRAMMSPLRSSEKNPKGNDVILRYNWLRMSLTTPVLIGMIVADERKYAPVLRKVMKARKMPMTSRVVVGPMSCMSCPT